MTKRLRVHPEAEAELQAAVAWYERHKEGLGDEFLAAADSALARISEHPEAGNPVTGVTASLAARRWLLRRFPYSIVYLETQSELQILAFAHSRRKPRFWLERASR